MESDGCMGPVLEVSSELLPGPLAGCQPGQRLVMLVLNKHFFSEGFSEVTQSDYYTKNLHLNVKSRNRPSFMCVLAHSICFEAAS